MSLKHSDGTVPLKRSEVSILSPLRYPGSKRRLAGYLKRVLLVNRLRPELFIEPFAGGASVSLQLLMEDAVESVGIADLDPLVAAFWKTVFFDTDWLVGQIEGIEVNIEKWHRFKSELPSDTRNKALKCLFLNRTNFSGIMAPNAGPIGGRLQQSGYKIDCRFPRQTLIRRIRQAESLANRVSFIWNLPWKRTIAMVEEMQHRGSLPAGVFYYFDPPFFEKADDLYAFWFTSKEHVRFRDEIIYMKSPWVISYDSVPRVRELYMNGSTNGTKVQALYSAGFGGLKNSEEAIITNLPLLPKETRLWRTREEWGS